ncbi:MAG: enoyl-CoA hydratase-related protein [Acidobacteriota bacterium]
MKKIYKTIETERIKGSLIIWLNRPEVHNAFNPEMLNDLLDIMDRSEKDETIRVIIFSGRGVSFSAGADINWMKDMIDYSYEENLRDSSIIADLFRKIYTLKKPVLSAVNGASIGGGMGFVATSDIVIASERSKFGLSEVRIGLIPAVISTYLLRKSSEGQLKELFITGRRFSPERALRAGLISDIVPHEDLIQTALDIAGELEKAGPDAIAACKELFLNVPGKEINEASEYTADVLAKLRVGKEAQEGMKAFLEKRKPSWIEKD